MPVAEALLTVEDYLALPDDGRSYELVRGRRVPVNMPKLRHGQVCVKTIRLVGKYLDADDRGHLVSNDTGVVTERDPDTVRGADVAFYSYERVPRGPLPREYLDVTPDLIFEVRSPGDRWGKILTKVGEYLEAGVTVVCVLDEITETAHVYRPDQVVQVFTADQELTLPDVLPGFAVTVQRFFE